MVAQGNQTPCPKKNLYRVEKVFFGAPEPNARGSRSGVWFSTQRPAYARVQNRDLRIPC